MQNAFKTYRCRSCGFIYSETEGWPEEGIVPGTLWIDVPDDWYCPQCGTEKCDFDMVEI